MFFIGTFLGTSAKTIQKEITKAKATSTAPKFEGVSDKAKQAVQKALNLTALNAGENPGIAKALDIWQKGSVPYAVQQIYQNAAGPSNTSGSPVGSGSPGTVTSSGDSPFTTKNGKVEFTDTNLQAAMEMINQQAAANNQWSAEQAQKQMDFQKMMSDTAHQREVADLKAAGLNPILSAGGQGAQVTSGAMAQTDESNTRLIAELAYAALDAVQNTAVGVSYAAGSNKKKGLMDNYYVKKALGAGATVAGAIAARAIMSAII